MSSFSTNQFDFDGVVFSADASDLTTSARIPLFHRVYDDAADLGLTLVSHKTGRELEFVITDVKKDSDGDVLHWTLAPVIATFVAATTLSVIIFND